MKYIDDLATYAGLVNGFIRQVPEETFERALGEINVSERIFVAGNGGSAAIANHWVCDHMKGSGVQCISLASNVPLITALANDNGYENIFKDQLKMHEVNSKDLLVLISSSGLSPNIVKAVEHAKLKSITTIGLTGFAGGKLMVLSDLNFHIPINNYGIVEDSHQIIMHCLAQHRMKQNDDIRRATA